jgi:hypothetical protein
MAVPIALPYDDIIILTGQQSHEVSLSVSKRVLRESVVLRSWLDHPDQRPASVRWGDTIILRALPEVALAVLRFLEDPAAAQAALLGACSDHASEKAMFLMRVYKLANCLA